MSFLFKCFIVIFGFFFLLAYLTRNYRNPYKLYMVFGKKGSGKSTYLISEALRYQKKGYIVYTNMLDCAVPGVRLIDVNQLGRFVPEANSLLVLDEVGMIWDSRDFKAFKPEVRDFFKLQRHYKVICILASQTWDIDKKLRDLTDGLYLFVNVFNVFSIGKRIVRKIVLTEATSEAESRISENLKFAPIWNWKFLFIPKYKAYYNSFDVPDTPKIRYKSIAGNPELIRHSKITYKISYVYNGLIIDFLYYYIRTIDSIIFWFEGVFCMKVIKIYKDIFEFIKMNRMTNFADFLNYCSIYEPAWLRIIMDHGSVFVKYFDTLVLAPEEEQENN